jgi:hypothetical protein
MQHAQRVMACTGRHICGRRVLSLNCRSSRATCTPQQLDDKALKGMLEQLSEQEEATEKKKVVLNTRRCDDSDSDIDLEGL